jgi:hypothetical protein
MGRRITKLDGPTTRKPTPAQLSWASMRRDRGKSAGIAGRSRSRRLVTVLAGLALAYGLIAYLGLPDL